MELHEYYSEINSRIEKIDFDALWKDFKPLKFALYNDEKCFFDGQYIEKTDDFFANTAIEFNGEVIAIWNVSEPTDSDVLTSKIVHEMFHGFQTISGEKRYADEMDALFEYCYSNENLSVKAEENRLLSELAEHFDYAKFTEFLGLRKMRAEQFEYEFRYETSIEQIEGTANFVELQTLKILDESKYLRKLQRMISSVADTERLFPVRIACYDIGALLLLVCKNNGIPVSEDFSDKTFPEKLIENAAFMAVSLTDLQRIINEKGYTEEYQNGENQFGTKKSSEVDIYNTMVKNFNATMKQLIDMLPESPSGSNSKNAALDYITRRAGP